MYVEFFDRFGVMVDLHERQFLAQLIALPLVAGQVDGLREQVRLVEPVELLLDRFQPPLALGRSVLDLRRQLLPHVEHAIFHEPHVARRRLQQREFVHEQTFELRLAHVHGAAVTLAVVVGVMVVASFRPTSGQRAAARLAADKSSKWKIRMIAFTRRGHLDATVGDRLRAVERLFADQWLEITARGYTVIRTLDAANVDRISQHLAEALWRQHEATTRAQSALGDPGQHFLLGESASRVLLEHLAHE